MFWFYIFSDFTNWEFTFVEIQIYVQQNHLKIATSLWNNLCVTSDNRRMLWYEWNINCRLLTWHLTKWLGSMEVIQVEQQVCQPTTMQFTTFLNSATYDFKLHLFHTCAFNVFYSQNNRSTEAVRFSTRKKKKCRQLITLPFVRFILLCDLKIVYGTYGQARIPPWFHEDPYETLKDLKSHFRF